MRDRPPLLHRSWLASDKPVARLIARPVLIFLQTEAGGGAILLIATIAALVWVNSPFGSSYDSTWSTEIGLSFGGASFVGDLRHWVNDALMTLFFFVVGLEIKRELVSGELNDVRKAALPALAALGGMVVPALVFLAVNLGEPGARGWGIPMATDIAFAVGVLALLGRRIPSGLRVFLLSLAIVDDIGAILVIALFYSTDIALDWLVAAGALLLIVVLLRRARVLWVPVYAAVGVGVWFATFQSGVHATLAGVALGLLAPARAPEGGEEIPVAERLERLLHPWTSYLIVPLFALANAGLVLTSESLGDALTSRLTLGIVAGLLVGKSIGISATSWLAVRFGWGALPTGVTKRQMLGASVVAGIGFTVSLFITGLAFSDAVLVDAAKVGVLVASVMAGLLGFSFLRLLPSEDDGSSTGRARRDSNPRPSD